MDNELINEEIEELTSFSGDRTNNDMEIISYEDFIEMQSYLEDEVDRLNDVIDNVHQMLCSTLLCQNNTMIYQKIDECINILEDEL